MIIFFGISSLVGGTVLACLADRSTASVARIETAGGICLIAGLAAISGSLPLFS